MKTVFVDANVFLRFFTTGNEEQHDRAAGLFRLAAARKVALVTGPPVLFEIAWSLRSAYEQPKAKVLDALAAIASLPGLELTDSRTVEEALVLARTSDQEFADAYIMAASRQWSGGEIATFNQKHFERLGAVLHKF